MYRYGLLPDGYPLMATFEEIRLMSVAKEQAKEAQAFVGRAKDAATKMLVIRDAAIMRLYTEDEETQKAIGELLGLSQVAVSRIINPPEPKPKPPKKPRVPRARPRKPKDLS